MSVSGSTGCTLDIGGTGVLASEASWAAVGEIENLGELGDSRQLVTFLSLSDSRVKKAKGTADAGTLNLVVGYDAADAGQDALRAAADDASNVGYNFRVRLNDAPADANPGSGSESTPTTMTFKALVMSRRVNIGAANGTVTMNVVLDITTAITVVDPVAGT